MPTLAKTSGALAESKLWPITNKLPSSVKPLDVLVVGLTLTGMIYAITKPKSKPLKMVMDYAPTAIAVLSALDIPKATRPKRKSKKIAK